jgi:hypothetical protein
LSVKFLIFILFFFPFFLNGEIIQISKLKKPKTLYSIKRDLFSPDSLTPKNRISKAPVNQANQSKKAENQQKVLKNIEQRIFFEGYIVKSKKSFALLSINGEYFVSGEGDLVVENIQVKKIEKKKILLEIESDLIEIFLKGVNNE